MALHLLPPGGDDLGEDLRQLVSSPHGFVEEGAREVNGHGVVTLLENVVASLQILSVHGLVLSEYGKQGNIEGVDEPALQGGEGLAGELLEMGDPVADGLGGEGAEDKLPQLGMVLSLVKEYGFLPQHPLLAGRECGLEQMTLGHQHKLGSFRARYHHAATPQDVSLEDGPVSINHKQTKDHVSTVYIIELN